MSKGTEIEQKRPVGRPSLYKPEYCQRLVDHMGQGNSFESFAAEVGVAFDTLYTWEEAHPEFSEAKNKGLALNLKFYENMAKIGMSGQLRRLAKETPMLDADGKLVTDEQGQIVYVKEYAPAQFIYVPWIFIMKNRFPKLYRDQRNIALSGDGKGGPIRLTADMSEEEKLKELREMNKFLQEIESAGKPVIDVTPKK